MVLEQRGSEARCFLDRWKFGPSSSVAEIDDLELKCNWAIFHEIRYINSIYRGLFVQKAINIENIPFEKPQKNSHRMNWLQIHTKLCWHSKSKSSGSLSTSSNITADASVVGIDISIISHIMSVLQSIYTCRMWCGVAKCLIAIHCTTIVRFLTFSARVYVHECTIGQFKFLESFSSWHYRDADK